MNSYITHLGYFATGEGFIKEFAYIRADNIEAAITRHLEKFKLTEYFRVGVEVNTVSEVLLNKNHLIHKFFTPMLLKELQKADELGAMGDFYFHFNGNYS